MKNKKILLALVLVAIVGVVGGTYAYFTSTATVNNEFKTGTYATSVTEEFTSPTNWKPGDVTTKKVNVTNKGTVDVAARASYTESWTASDGTKLDLTRDNEAVAQFTIGSDWELAKDGYYYYNDILGTDDVSTDFISSVTFNPNFKLEEGKDIKCTKVEEEGKTTIDCENLTSGYAGATYRLNITIETIQADQKWDYTKVYAVGEEITIAEEAFNVVKDNGDTVTLLAAYNLGEDYRQSETNNYVGFSNDKGWNFRPGPKEIDIQLYDGSSKTYVNNYVTYLKEITGDNNLSATLITLSQLKELGCTINDDYSYTKGLTCANSEHSAWLVNEQGWWTRSATSVNANLIWLVEDGGDFLVFSYSHECGVRPLITISKDALSNL